MSSGMRMINPLLNEKHTMQLMQYLCDTTSAIDIMKGNINVTTRRCKNKLCFNLQMDKKFVRSIIERKRKLGWGNDKWSNELADDLHGSIRRKFKKRQMFQVELMPYGLLTWEL